MADPPWDRSYLVFDVLYYVHCNCSLYIHTAPYLTYLGFALCVPTMVTRLPHCISGQSLSSTLPCLPTGLGGFNLESIPWLGRRVRNAEY